MEFEGISSHTRQRRHLPGRWGNKVRQGRMPGSSHAFCSFKTYMTLDLGLSSQFCQDPRSRGPRSSSQGSLHILGAMAWASVGYMALTVADNREFKREYGSDLAEGRSLCGTSAQFPSGFVESSMKAMVLTRKDRVRRLGGAPSDGDKAVKMHLRAAGDQFKDAIQCTNYVILHLKTKDNIADAISCRELQLEDGAYVVRGWWSPFQELPFKDKSKWMLTLEPLACIMSCHDGGLWQTQALLQQAALRHLLPLRTTWLSRFLKQSMPLPTAALTSPSRTPSLCSLAWPATSVLRGVTTRLSRTRPTRTRCFHCVLPAPQRWPSVSLRTSPNIFCCWR